MKIILVDDNKTFSEGLKFYLEAALGFEVIACYNNGEEFINGNEYPKCDLIFMDIEMPVIDGIKATKLALWRARNLKIIAITGFKEKAYLSELIGAGCKGCVFKDNVYEELETAIQQVMAGKLYYPGDLKLQNDVY
jgi:two-component system, NarL family, response regulator LiaR